MNSITVLSTSNIKKEAFEKSKLNDLFVETNYVSIDDIVTTNKLKELPPQPVNETGRLCAHKRIDYYRKYGGTNQSAFVIAIENYIDITQVNASTTEVNKSTTEVNASTAKVDAFAIAYDKCCIVVDFNGNRYEYVSTECNKDAAFYPDEIKELGVLQTDKYEHDGYDKTIGEVVIEQMTPEDHILYPTVYENNWIEMYNNFDRIEQIMCTLNLVNYEKIIKDQITVIQNFPKQGIAFKNILPIFSNNITYVMLMSLCESKLGDFKPDYIVGLESRGFIFGAALAGEIGCGFVGVRKAGKLPDDTYSVEYVKEYGSDKFEISKSAMKKNCKVLIVDDLLATGGTLKAAIQLVNNFDPTAIMLMVMDVITECADMAEKTLSKDVVENKLIVVL